MSTQVFLLGLAHGLRDADGPRTTEFEYDPEWQQGRDLGVTLRALADGHAVMVTELLEEALDA